MSDSALPYVYVGPVAAASSVLPVVATVLLGARIFARHHSKQGIGIDDWLLVPATICCWAMGAILLRGVQRKLVGYPAPPPTDPATYNQLTDLVPGQAELQQLEYAFFIVMILTFGFIKLAVLFFYRRVFAVARTFGIITWIAIAVCSIWMIAFFLGQVLACGTKPWAYWGPLGQQSLYCAKGLDFLLSLASTDLATDVFVFFLPFPVIWRLQMPLKRKLFLSAIFLLGALSLIASAFRLSLHVDQYTATYDKQVDLYLTFTIAFYWSMLEAGIALIAINLPTLNHFIGNRSIQSMVGSVRSVLSLRSLSPRGSGSSGRNGNVAKADATRAHSDDTNGRAAGHPDDIELQTGF